MDLVLLQPLARTADAQLSVRLISSSGISRCSWRSMRSISPGAREPFERHTFVVDREHAGLGRHDHQIVVRHDVAGGTETVPVERRTHHACHR